MITFTIVLFKTLYPSESLNYSFKARWNFFFLSYSLYKKLPPPETPASERSTKPRPTMHMAAPKNCSREYLVPMNIHVRIMAHGTVQQSNSVTLVIEENW